MLMMLYLNIGGIDGIIRVPSDQLEYKGTKGSETSTKKSDAKSLNTLYKATQQITDDNFKTFVPYINCVTDHWYRDVFFTYNAIKDHKQQDHIIQIDEEYEE